jgi:anti-sigma B factor antagonist
MSNAPDAEDLVLETRRADGAVIIEARGEVTVFTSPVLRQAMRQGASERPGKLIVDLSGTTYIDSSGVATLVEGLKLVQQHDGELILAGMNERVRGVFEIARLDAVFELADSVEEALQP